MSDETFINQLTDGTNSGSLKWDSIITQNHPAFPCSYYTQKGKNYLTLETMQSTMFNSDGTLDICYVLSICDDKFTKLYVLTGAYVQMLYNAVMRQMYDIDDIMNNFVAGIV